MGSFKDALIVMIPRLRAYAIALSGSSAQADDLVQETLMRAWRFQAAFQPGTNLRAWLFKILRNAFLADVGRPRALQDVDGKFSNRLISAPDQESHLEYDELLDQLSRLAPETRDALLLVAGAGFTYEEAAEICSCAVGTVKSRVNRARGRLAAVTAIASPRRDPGANTGRAGWA